MDNEPASPGDRSELRAGFAWAWATAAGSLLLAGLVAFAIGQLHTGGNSTLMAGTIPPLALLALLAGTWFGGKRDMARGVLAAFGTMFAVVLLGVAACFGIFGISGL